MKLITFTRPGSDIEEVGVLTDGLVSPLRALGFSYPSMNALICRSDKRELAQIVERAALAVAAAKAPILTDPPEWWPIELNMEQATACIPLDEVELCSPIPRPLQDVLCLGLNYRDHAAEAKGFSQSAFGVELAAPIFFSKRVGRSQGSGAPIPAHQDLTQQLDFENELAVIIGRDAENVPEEDVADYIFGYTICNDVSAREVQTRHKQWYFGKSLEGFCPMGPCIVTADEIPFPPKLRISTTLNGVLRQDSDTGCLIHSIAEIVSTLSRGMVLRAGTIIATGTPKGVLMGDAQPRFLRHGDVVVCSIEGIGDLVNTVD